MVALQSTLMKAGDVLVIGAGPAGLAVSACLRREGVPHRVVERTASVAASWRGHYDRLHLHTGRRLSRLPFTPWPRGTPMFPSRAEVIRYLEQYAVRHQVMPRFGVDVQHVRPRGTGFEVETSIGELTPRVVVVATGYNRVPHVPTIPRLEQFTGAVVHSAAYKNPTLYRGRRVLVVGCGNSGAEIALDLADAGVDVTMVVRGAVHVAPRTILGCPAQELNVLLARLPLLVRDGIAGTILDWKVGDLSPWGIVRPVVGLNRTIETTGRIPLIDVGTVAAVKAGRIRVRPGIAEVGAAHVMFADGRSEPYDAIILATGYRTGLEQLIDGVEHVIDERGHARQRNLSNARGLYFVGFRNPASGALREIAREAPRVAGAIRQLQRDVALPHSE